MTYVGLVFLTLLFWDWTRTERINAEVLRTQYQLFEIRDKLRESAMQDAEFARSWLFAYLDSTISRTITVLPKATLWHAALVYIVKKRSGNEAFVLLANELEKPKNIAYKHIHLELIASIALFLRNRHVGLVRTVLIMALVFAGMRKLAKTTANVFAAVFVQSIGEPRPQETPSWASQREMAACL